MTDDVTRSAVCSDPHRRVPLLALAIGVALFAALSASFVAAQDDSQEDASCQAARCAVKAQLDQACPCATAKSPDDYGNCLEHKARQLGVSEKCSEEIEECGEDSTCGRPGAVACSVANNDGDNDDDDHGSCTIEKSASACQKEGGVATGRTDCCESCPVCAGGTCTVGGDCTSQFCQGGICQPVTAGGSCVCGGDCTSQFCDGGVCQSVCAGGTCAAGGDCTSGFCQGGVCQPVAAGGSCVCGGDCTSQHCEGGTCQPNCAGGPCVFGGDCTSQFCLAGTCQPVFTGGSCTCGGDCLTQFCNNGVCGEV